MTKFKKSPVSIKTCKNSCINGTCKKGICFCFDGWFGDSCEKCTPHKNCKNGFCKNEPGECICSTPSFVGRFCDENINPCEPENPCGVLKVRNHCLFKNSSHFQCCGAGYKSCSKELTKHDVKVLNFSNPSSNQAIDGLTITCYLIAPILLLLTTLILILTNTKIIKKVRKIESRTNYLESRQMELPEVETSVFLKEKRPPPPYEL